MKERATRLGSSRMQQQSSSFQHSIPSTSLPNVPEHSPREYSARTAMSSEVEHIGVGVADGVSVTSGVGVTEAEGAGVAPPVGVGVGVPEALGVGVAEAEGMGIPLTTVMTGSVSMGRPSRLLAALAFAKAA